MSISTYTPDSMKILHTAYADFVSRQIGRTVHVVQYDDELPILAVKLFSDGQPYTIPSNADVNIKLGKSDGTFVYNPALGCDLTRHIVYFEITYQMVILAGEVSPVIEVIIDSSVSASSSISIIIDRNPIQRDSIKSTSEWKTIIESVEYAKEAINAAASASSSMSAAAVSEVNAKESEVNAKESENNIKGAESTCIDCAKRAESYAVGDTDYRENESVNNAKYYYEQIKQISDGLGGILLPMGTIKFSELPSQTKIPGYMYNISDDFVSDDTFKDGGNIPYPAGTNVYYTFDGYWDCLAGTNVTSVNGKKGDVDITPENIGALRTDGNTKDNFVTFQNDDEVTHYGTTDVSTGEVVDEKYMPNDVSYFETAPINFNSKDTFGTIFNKISRMFHNTRVLKNIFGLHVCTIASHTEAGHVKVDTALSSTSTNPVENKAVNTALRNKMAATPANIELTGGATNGGYIDFHYKNSSEDYTSRIIEDAEHRLNLVAQNGVLINGRPIISPVTAHSTIGFPLQGGPDIQSSLVVPIPAAVRTGTIVLIIAYCNVPQISNLDLSNNSALRLTINGVGNTTQLSGLTNPLSAFYYTASSVDYVTGGLRLTYKANSDNNPIISLDLNVTVNFRFIGI